jgi:hypothetical protein
MCCLVRSGERMRPQALDLLLPVKSTIGSKLHPLNVTTAAPHVTKAQVEVAAGSSSQASGTRSQRLPSSQVE